MKYLDLIRAQYGDLTENQRRLADVIISSPDAAFLTTTDIAKVADVSQSAVVRFAQALGYDGYPQLQKELQSNLIGRLNPSERLAKSQHSDGDLSEKIIEIERRQLEWVSQAARSAEFQKTLSMIEKSKRTFVMGVRASYSAAHLFTALLGCIKSDVKLLSNASGAVADEIAHIGRSDLLVAFSFSRYSVLTLKAMRLARERHSKVVAITDSTISPAARLSDVALEIPAASGSFFTSYVPTTCLVNVMIAHLAERQGGRALQSLQALEQILEDWEHLGE